MAAALKPGPASAPGSQPLPALTAPAVVPTPDVQAGSPTTTPDAPIVATPPTPDAAHRAETAEVHGDTRAQLSALRAQADTEINDFSAQVREGSSDFAGSDSAETLDQNPAFTKIMAGLREILQTAELEGIPANFTDPWMKAVTQFMLAEIRSYGPSWKVWQTWGKMGIPEAKQALENIRNPSAVGRSGLKGVGAFDVWITSSPLAQEFDKWKSEQEQQEEEAAQTQREAEATATQQAEEAQTQTAALTVERDKGTIHMNQLLTLLSSLSATVVPPQFRANIEGYKSKLDTAPDVSAIAALDKELTNLEAEITKYEQLDEVAKDITAPEREAILKAVRDEDKKPEVAQAELEKLKKTKQNQVQSAARGEQPKIDAAIDLIDEFDVGDSDTWYGKLGASVKYIITALLGGVGTLVAQMPWARKWIVGQFNWFSNEKLAEYGDPRAKDAQKAEDEFAKFGVPTKYANILGERKARDVIGMIRTPARLTKLAPDTATDATLKARFEQLASQLEAKGDSTSDVKLFDLMRDESKWVSIQYEAAGAVATPAAPAQQPTAPAETTQAKVAKIFEGMTPNAQTDLKAAKVKDVAAGILPPLIAQDDRVKKIAAKITANGGALAATTNAELTVEAFITTSIDKDWTIT